MTASKDLVAMKSPTADKLLQLKNQRATDLPAADTSGAPSATDPNVKVVEPEPAGHDTTVADTAKVPAAPMKGLRDKEEMKSVEEELELSSTTDNVNSITLNLSKLSEQFKLFTKKDKKEDSKEDEKEVELSSDKSEDKESEDKDEDKKKVAEAVAPKPEEEDKEEDDSTKEKVAESLKLSLNFTEGDELFKDVTALSEDEKRQAKGLFESAVRVVAIDLAAQIQEAYEGYVVKLVEAYQVDMAKKVDAHINYVVENWSKQNAVALESKFKTQLNESFIGSLKTLLESHFIEVPTDKENVLNSLSEDKTKLEAQLQESEAKNVELHETLQEDLKRSQAALVKEHKARLIAEASVVLPSSERGKFSVRALTLEFKNTKDFKQNLITLREQYDVADTVVLERRLDVPNATPSFEPNMSTKDPIEAMYGAALDSFVQTK